jgi:integrating conjugative element protein (TIGR03752 family)
MSSGSANKLIPLLAIGAVVGVGAIMFFGDKLTSPSSGTETTSGDVPIGFDADTPQDTLQTLTQELGKLQYDSKGTEESLAIMRRSQEKQSEEMARVQNELRESRSANMTLTQKIDQQTELLKERTDAPQTTIVNEPVDTDALKQDLLGEMKVFMGEMFKQQTPQPAETAPVIYDQSSGESKVRIFPLGTAISDSGVPVTTGGNGDSSPLDDVSTPFYTIPKDAILMGATTITSLIGRVPIQGNVSDPAPFKIHIGADNMAANGYQIPGISGMFMSGHATGDKALSCVRAYVESASFVFDDGRTLNVSSNSSGGSGSGKKLGWLSDAHGNACIPGKYISTALKTGFWATMLGIGTGAADAYSQSQVTNTYGPYGGGTSRVTGSDTDYVAGAALSGGTKALTRQLERRMQDSWDGVVVLSGRSVAFHADTELKIDYDDNNRLVDYTASGQSVRWRD